MQYNSPYNAVRSRNRIFKYKYVYAAHKRWIITDSESVSRDMS